MYPDTLLPIDGDWTDVQSGVTLPDLNPATGLRSAGWHGPARRISIVPLR